jgi:hypothetical protein
MQDFLLYLSLFLILISSIIFIYFSFFSKRFFKNAESSIAENSSMFGEFINGVTGPLFALAGFLVIYSTILDSNKTNQIQNFESSFFTMLKFHRENNREISISKSPFNCEERLGFQVWVNFKSQIDKASKIIDTSMIFKDLNKEQRDDLAFEIFYFGTSDKSLKKVLSKKYKKIDEKLFKKLFDSIPHCEDKKEFFQGNKARLNLCVSNYFSTLTFIDQVANLESKEKDKYITLLNSQNGSYESLIYYLFFKSDYCSEEFKRIYSKYCQNEKNKFNHL